MLTSFTTHSYKSLEDWALIFNLHPHKFAKSKKQKHHSNNKPQDPIARSIALYSGNNGSPPLHCCHCWHIIVFAIRNIYTIDLHEIANTKFAHVHNQLPTQQQKLMAESFLDINSTVCRDTN